MATEISDSQAQSASPTPPAGDAMPPGSTLSNPSPAQQLADLDLEQLQSVTERLNPDRATSREGVDAGEKAPQTEPVVEVKVPEEEAPATDDKPAEGQPDEPEDAEPGRIRIDRIADERTRAITAFLARNRDATIDDAITAVDGTAEAPAAKQAPVAPPNTAAIETRITDLKAQIKTKSDPLADGYDLQATEDLREQLMDAKVDLRDAQNQVRDQAATLVAQRMQSRQASAASAVAMCPEIEDVSSPQGKEFARIYAQYEARQDPILQNDEAPELITLKVMRLFPAKPAAEAAPASTPSKPVTPPVAPVPRSTVPVARTTAPVATTAPGSARLAEATTPNATQLMDVLRDADLETLMAVADGAGKKLAPPAGPFSFA